MKKIFSIYLIVLLLLSNISLTMATHYCAGFAVKSQLMLGKGELDCGMHTVKEECPRHADGKERIKKVPCCENEYLSIDIEKDFNQSNKINFELEWDIPTSSFFVENYIPELIFPQYGNYYPPPLERDIQVLFQTFII